MKLADNWRNRFRDTRLSRKITITFLTAALLLCAIMAAALQITFRIYDNYLYEKSQAELDFFAQQVNAKLSQIEELTVSIATGSEVQNQLSRMQEMEYLSPEYNYARQQLMTILQNKIFSQDIIKNVIYTDQNQITFMAGTYTGELDSQVKERLLQQFHEKSGGYVLLSPAGDYPYLISGRDILEVKNATLSYLGSLIFTSDIGAWIGKMSLPIMCAGFWFLSICGMIRSERWKRDGDEGRITNVIKLSSENIQPWKKQQTISGHFPLLFHGVPSEKINEMK